MLEKYQERYNFTGDLEAAIYFVGHWVDYETNSQPKFMKDHGLRPEHSFLDLGCGCLRGTAPLVSYMDQNNFFGIDISRGLLERAFEQVLSLNILRWPLLFLAKDYEFYKLTGRKFDYILSVSLLTHLLPDIIFELFSGVRQILHPSGVWYFTMYPIECAKVDPSLDHYGDIEISYYNRRFLIEMGVKAGLFIEDVDEGTRKNVCPGSASQFCPEVNSTLGQWVMKATRL